MNNIERTIACIADYKKDEEEYEAKIKEAKDLLDDYYKREKELKRLYGFEANTSALNSAKCQYTLTRNKRFLSTAEVIIRLLWKYFTALGFNPVMSLKETNKALSPFGVQFKFNWDNTFGFKNFYENALDDKEDSIEVYYERTQKENGLVVVASYSCLDDNDDKASLIIPWKIVDNLTEFKADVEKIIAEFQSAKEAKRKDVEQTEKEKRRKLYEKLKQEFEPQG